MRAELSKRLEMVRFIWDEIGVLSNQVKIHRFNLDRSSEAYYTGHMYIDNARHYWNKLVRLGYMKYIPHAV